MILTSPSEDVAQSPPVTTTFDPPANRRRYVTRRPRAPRHDRIDWDRVEQLYSFVRERAVEHLRKAEQARDQAAASAERQNVHAVDTMFAQARQRHGVVAACAITFFRARAMRDAQHPDFRGEWLGAGQLSPA
jgi:hypothetical protein